MKTTIEISDNLFKEAKQWLARENKTMKEAVEISLRRYIHEQKAKNKKPFKFRNCSFKGEGLVDPSLEGDWPRIRELIYEGHGG